jgi:hypothetical protein
MAEQSCNEHLLFTGCFAHLQAAGFTIPGVEKEFTKNPSGKKNSRFHREKNNCGQTANATQN